MNRREWETHVHMTIQAARYLSKEVVPDTSLEMMREILLAHGRGEQMPGIDIRPDPVLDEQFKGLAQFLTQPVNLSSDQIDMTLGDVQRPTAPAARAVAAQPNIPTLKETRAKSDEFMAQPSHFNNVVGLTAENMQKFHSMPAGDKIEVGWGATMERSFIDAMTIGTGAVKIEHIPPAEFVTPPAGPEVKFSTAHNMEIGGSNYPFKVERAPERQIADMPIKTLLDEFAMAALATIAGYPNLEAWGESDFAKTAYLLADAMMKERDK